MRLGENPPPGKRVVTLAFKLLQRLKGTLFHPEWLSDRFHHRSRQCLKRLHARRIVDVGSGDSDHRRLLPQGALIRVDYPRTNDRYQIRPDLYGDACQLPIASGCVDAVLLFEVLEHVTDEVGAIQEAVRILKLSGKLYLSVPFNYPLHDLPNDFRRFTIYGLRHLLEGHGLVIDQEWIHGNSVVCAMQMFNLSLLEIAHSIHMRHPIFGILVGLAMYPVCLGINLLAWPLTWISGVHRSCFGYFIIARRA